MYAVVLLSLAVINILIGLWVVNGAIPEFSLLNGFGAGICCTMTYVIHNMRQRQ